MSRTTSIRIGGASGFWGDAALATPQLLAGGDLDFIVYDYLAEITLSIMARARAADPTRGYATDFVTAAMAPNLEALATGGVRVLSNAGGVNPQACAEALRALIDAQGLQLRVAVIGGDDLLPRAADFADHREMFTGEGFPEPEAIASMNAYLGAFPIARALDAGADIVITGRCVDSAVTLGACIHAFGWTPQDYDRLAQGSLAGHILECGTQATGGNFTDWQTIIEHLPQAGYPIADVEASGRFVVGKAADTGGLVSEGTVGEQMLYEIGDPEAYALPDVLCDFTRVKLVPEGENRVAVSGARGRGAPAQYKVSATWADGYRAGQIWTMIGRDAQGKAQHFAASVIERSNRILAERGLPPLTETSVEILGGESHFGDAARYVRSREVDLKIAAKHPAAAGIGVFLKEMAGLALTAPPGLAAFAGARPKPTPVVRLFSLLVDRAAVPAWVEIEGARIDCPDAGGAPAPEATAHPVPPATATDDMVDVPLELLAFGRSGDKGNKANVGIMARHADFLPWIAAHLTADHVARFFSHFLAEGQAQPVERFYLPGTNALNFLLHAVLGGGGVASLRADPQGKAYAQLLLTERVPVPRALASAHALPGEDAA